MGRSGVVKINVTGLRELQATLLEIPDQMERYRALHRTLVRVADPMLSSAKSNVDSERMDEKLIVSGVLSKRQRREEKTKKGRVTVYVGVKPSPLAHLLEFGTGPRFTKPRYKGDTKTPPEWRGVMPPQPFLRPAFDANAMAALNQLGVLLKEEIEAAAKRARK